MKSIMMALILFWTSSALGQQRIGSAFAAQSYYGFTGLTFIPTTQTPTAPQWRISYCSKPSSGADLQLNPFSVGLSYGKKAFELALTNTAIYASHREYGGVNIQQGVAQFSTGLPLFPAIKYQLMPMIQANYHVAMAVGIALPYGAYYVVDKYLDLKYVDLTVHTGVATKLTTYHAFAGATFTFGRRIESIQRDLPLEMVLEAGWGGSLKQLNEKEEAFVAISFRQAWTSALFIKTFFRIDSQPLVEDDRMIRASPTKRMGIGLDFSWH